MMAVQALKIETAIAVSLHLGIRLVDMLRFSRNWIEMTVDEKAY